MLIVEAPTPEKTERWFQTGGRRSDFGINLSQLGVARGAAQRSHNGRCLNFPHISVAAASKPPRLNRAFVQIISRIRFGIGDLSELN